MVAGIIGATWDNNAGIEGVYPRPLTIVSIGGLAERFDLDARRP